MFLMEIKPGSQLTIVIKHGKDVLEFNTVALRPEKDTLLVSPIMKDGKMINFVEISNIIYQMTFINSQDNRLYKWSRIRIKAVKDEKGQLYHMLVSDLEGQPHNRRQSFRVSIDIDGVARFGPNQKAYEILIKDISSSGIGFICKQNVDISNDLIIHITFEDKPLHISFKIDCQAIRKDYDKEEEEYIYGCKFKNESAAVNNYVQKKQQRIRLAKNPYAKRQGPPKK